MRRMQQLNSFLFQRVGKNDVIPVPALLSRVHYEEKIGRKGAEFASIMLPPDQEVITFAVKLGEVHDHISNISANSEIIQLSNVKSDSHLLSVKTDSRRAESLRLRRRCPRCQPSPAIGLAAASTR